MSQAGYSGTPLAAKLGIKPGSTVVVENAIAGCRSECELRLSRLEDSGERVVRTGDHIQAIHNRRRQVLEERHEHLKALSDLREQRSGWKARKSVLEDLERR